MKRLLVFYSHFTPAYKAGGPIQSLRNLVESIKDKFIIDIVCGAYDLGDKSILENIVPDQWNEFDKNVSILYISQSGISRIINIFYHRRPDVIYVNGVFLPLYSWLPMFMARLTKVKVVFSPRGMLQSGAVTSKGLKKKIFLKLFKALGFHRRLVWHATDEQEKLDVEQFFGKHNSIVIIPNLPRKPFPVVEKRKKNVNELRLIYLSVIAEKKNLLLILKALQHITTPIIFDIYGPIKDRRYWKQCESLLQGQVHTIKYLGPVVDTEVQNVLTKYHTFVLPTKGENFGHAIFDALSVGTPVITSQYTPWGILQDKNCGITIDVHEPRSLTLAIEKFISLSEEEFLKLSLGAHKLALSFGSIEDKDKYVNLFS
jgi:glycosyltransferase involved in cell wall biosynthesis